MYRWPHSIWRESTHLHRPSDKSKQVIVREAAAGTNQHAYFLNKLLMNLLYCVIHTTSFLLVFYPMINFPFEYKLLWAWVFLCFFCSSGMGLLFAVLYRTPHVVVGILLTVINLFLGGALVTLTDLGSWAVLTYISPARWLGLTSSLCLCISLYLSLFLSLLLLPPRAFAICDLGEESLLSPKRRVKLASNT